MTKSTVKKAAKSAKKTRTSAKNEVELQEDLDEAFAEEMLSDADFMKWIRSHDNIKLKLKGELQIEEQNGADEQVLEDDLEDLADLEDFADDALTDEDGDIVEEVMPKRRGGKKRKDPLADMLPAEVETEEGAENGYRQLVRFGRSRGWVTIAEINDLLPESALRSEDALGEITLGLARFGVQVFDQTPDEDTIAMLAEQQATVDDDIDEEDAATILTPEESAGLSKDPLRAYLRGVGSHKLLTREGEIEVAKSIELHRARLVQIVLMSPLSIQELLNLADKVRDNTETIDNVIDGFTDVTGDEIEEDGDLNTDIGAAAMTV
ncbi:MAG: RNA polymerase sigma factor region1.1 domain-containing protein, partial [Candidatus Aphodousia sp.]|nr:RNA polymerase sigma factor region1.1 domain-containing protein [Candidatus Aphodousia sp.]